MITDMRQPSNVVIKYTFVILTIFLRLFYVYVYPRIDNLHLPGGWRNPPPLLKSWNRPWLTKDTFVILTVFPWLFRKNVYPRMDNLHLPLGFDPTPLLKSWNRPWLTKNTFLFFWPYSPGSLKKMSIHLPGGCDPPPLPSTSLAFDKVPSCLVLNDSNIIILNLGSVSVWCGWPYRGVFHLIYHNILPLEYNNNTQNVWGVILYNENVIFDVVS